MDRTTRRRLQCDAPLGGHRAGRTAAHGRGGRLEAARQMCEDVRGWETPLSLERWASGLLGQLWDMRDSLPDEVRPYWAQALGTPILEDIAQIGDHGARLILKAVSRLEPGGLGMVASDLLWDLRASEEFRAVAGPPWLGALGAAEIVSAGAEICPGQGEGIVLEARGDLVAPHALAVFVDTPLGDVAKIAAVIAPEAERAADSAGFVALSPVEIGPACERICAAIARTDALVAAPVAPGFAEARALILARASLVCAAEDRADA